MNAIGANDGIRSGGGAIRKVQDNGFISTIVVFDRDQTFAHVYAILGDGCDEVVDEMCAVARLQSRRAFLGMNMLAGVGAVTLDYEADMLRYLLLEC